MRILITGAAGRLGAAMNAEFRAAGYAVTAAGRREMDITDESSVKTAVGQLQPNVIVNCSAYNAVDKAEADAASAYRINRDGPAILARTARESGALLVHFSTDFVFDGGLETPYPEDSPTNPLSVYGASKLAGEHAARVAPKHYILRLASLYGGEGRGGHRATVDYIADTLLAGGVVRCMVDRTVSPSYVPDVVRATRELISSGARYGTYHCVNSGSTTWYDLACAAARSLATVERVLPITSIDVRTIASRPRFCALSNQKLVQTGVDMPHWQFALLRHLAARAEPIPTPRRRILVPTAFVR